MMSDLVSLFRFLNAIINGIMPTNEQRQLTEIIKTLSTEKPSEIERRITRYEKINSAADFPVVRRISASKKESIHT